MIFGFWDLDICDNCFIFGFCDICDICLIFSVTFVIFSVTFSVTFVIFAWYFISLSILHWRFVFASRRSLFNISRGGELIEERPKSENTNHSPCLRMTASYHDCLILIDQKQLKMGDTYPSLSEWLITLYYGNWVLANLVALGVAGSQFQTSGATRLESLLLTLVIIDKTGNSPYTNPTKRTILQYGGVSSIWWHLSLIPLFVLVHCSGKIRQWWKYVALEKSHLPFHILRFHMFSNMWEGGW